jgi:glutamate synthase domain-containing protein 3
VVLRTSGINRRTSKNFVIQKWLNYIVETEADVTELKSLIENHKRHTNSSVAEEILSNWEKYLTQFIKVYPTDYKRVLENKLSA